jgi:hypothetical protein
MPGRVWWVVCAMLVLGGECCWAEKSCVRSVMEGEVRAGEGLVRPVGGGLEVMLEPLASGWILRVLPMGAARPAHDYAELATPPYQSVNPLLISTDFGFRAQDVVAWNPRRFHFAGDQIGFKRMLGLYEAYDRGVGEAGEELGVLAGRAPEGVFKTLDAHLVPGAADQSKMAAGVALHFSTTAHQMEQATDARTQALGRVTWMRFRIELELPRGFAPDRSIRLERGDCRE